MEEKSRGGHVPCDAARDALWKCECGSIVWDLDLLVGDRPFVAGDFSDEDSYPLHSIHGMHPNRRTDPAGRCDSTAVSNRGTDAAVIMYRGISVTLSSSYPLYLE